MKNCVVMWTIAYLFTVFMPHERAQAETPLRIVALGDSTTAGTPHFRSPVEAPPDGAGNPEGQYAYWIRKRHPSWEVYNRGVNAQRSDQIAKRFDHDVLALKPDILIVLAGVNDLYQGYSLDWVIDYLKSMYDRALKENIKVMACTIIPFDGATTEVQNRMRKVNEWIKRYTEEHKLGFCDTFHAVEDPKNPGNLISTDDEYHPDIKGYKKMGDAITDALEQWLHSAQ